MIKKQAKISFRINNEMILKLFILSCNFYLFIVWQFVATLAEKGHSNVFCINCRKY